MVEVENFDDIVFGGGKGGKSLAMALGPAGHKVALIERSQIGGTCINVACIPTKAMVASSKLLYHAKNGSHFGLRLNAEGSNLRDVIERKRRVVKGMVDAHNVLYANTQNMEFILGEAKFVEPRVIEVKSADGSLRRFTAPRIYINIGTKSSIPKMDGLENVPYLTSTSIMELEVLPDHLVVIGAGYIALEFAQIFNRLGSRVTVLQRSEQFLPKEDEDIAAMIKALLEDEGISIRTGVEFGGITGSDTITVNLKTGNGEEPVSCSHLLVAVGRGPNTAGIGLDIAGVDLDQRGYIKVNEKLETSAANIWAIGDCNGGPHFTHVSWDDYRIIKDNVLHNMKRTTTGRIVPYTLFIDPELGRVGLTEAQAREKGLDILVAKVPASKIPRATTSGETRGLLKAVIDKKTKQILGCSILAHEGGEVMSVIQTAMLGGLPYTAVRDTIFAHPTMAESLNILFAQI